MAIEYSWEIRALERELGPDGDGHENVITKIHYDYKADEGEGTSEMHTGMEGMAWEEGDEWIDFSDIEESDIISWLEDRLGEEGIGALQGKLSARIEEKVTPTKDTVRDMPWIDDED